LKPKSLNRRKKKEEISLPDKSNKNRHKDLKSKWSHTKQGCSPDEAITVRGSRVTGGWGKRSVRARRKKGVVTEHLTLTFQKKQN